MVLQGLKIGGIQGIGGFGGLTPPNPSSPAEQNTPQMQTPSPVVNTTTGSVPSFSGTQNFSGIGSEIDTKINEIQSQQNIPQIDISKGFGTPQISQGFGNMSQSGIAPSFDNLAKNKPFMDNFKFEQENGVSKEDFDSVFDLSPYEMSIMKKKQAEGFTKDEFIASVARKRKEQGVTMIEKAPGFEEGSREEMEDKVKKSNKAVIAGFVGSFPKILGNIVSFAVRENPTLGYNQEFAEQMIGRELTEDEKKSVVMPTQIADSIQEMGQKAKDEVYKFLGTEEGAGGYGEKGAELAAELIPLFLIPEATIGQAGAGLLSKLPILSKLLKYPLAKKAIGNAIGGMAGMEGFAIASKGENASTLELVLGGVLSNIGILYNLGKAGISKAGVKLAQKLETSGVINPAKFDSIKNRLILMGDDGLKKAGVSDVSQWMLDREIQGGASKMVTQLEKRATDSVNVLDDVLAKSKKTYSKADIEVAESVLAKLELEYSDSISGIYADRLKLVREYQAKLKNGELTLKELNSVKQMVWKDLNPYTASGKVKVAKTDLQQAASQLRVFIEKEAAATIKGVASADIALLNNEISTSIALAEGIARKESTNFRETMLSFMTSKGGGTIAGGMAGANVGPFDSNTTMGKFGNILVGAFVGSLAGNTKVKSYVANRMNTLFGKEASPILEKYLEALANGKIIGKEFNSVEQKINTLVKELKALPSPKDITTSNLGTASNPIVSKGPQIPTSQVLELGSKTPFTDQSKGFVTNKIEQGFLSKKSGIQQPIQQPGNQGLGGIGEQLIKNRPQNTLPSIPQGTPQTTAPGLSNLGKTSARPVEIANQGVGTDVGITNVKGFKDQFIDKFVDDAAMFEAKGDYANAKLNYDRSIARGQEILKQEFGDNIASMEGTVGRYFGESEPTIALKLKNVKDADINKLIELSEGSFKQKSFFTAKPISSSEKLGVIDKTTGLSNEPGIIVNTKKTIGLENMKELDTIMNEVGLPGATILPGGKGIKIYNLSAYETNYGKFIEQAKELTKRLKANDRFGLLNAPKEGSFRVRHLGINKGEGLGTYEGWRNRGNNPVGEKGVTKPVAPVEGPTGLSNLGKTKITKEPTGVKAKDVTTPDGYKGKIGANSTEKQIVKYAEDNAEIIKKEYLAKEGNVYNTDNIRQFLGEKVGVEAGTNQKAANMLNSKRKKEMLDTIKPGEKVMFLGGGAGSAKSFTMEGGYLGKSFEQIKKDYAGVIDTTFSKKSNIDFLKELDKKGIGYDINFVFSPEVNAYTNMLERYLGKTVKGEFGRKVPFEKGFNPGHEGALENMAILHKEGIPFQVIMNKGSAANPIKPTTIEYSELVKDIEKYKKVTKQEAQSMVKEFTIKGNKIDPTKYSAFLAILVAFGLTTKD